MLVKWPTGTELGPDVAGTFANILSIISAIYSLCAIYTWLKTCLVYPHNFCAVDDITLLLVCTSLKFQPALCVNRETKASHRIDPSGKRTLPSNN